MLEYVMERYCFVRVGRSERIGEKPDGHVEPGCDGSRCHSSVRLDACAPVAPIAGCLQKPPVCAADIQNPRSRSYEVGALIEKLPEVGGSNASQSSLAPVLSDCVASVYRNRQSAAEKSASRAPKRLEDQIRPHVGRANHAFHGARLYQPR
jgi:hypothetical protein